MPVVPHVYTTPTFLEEVGYNLNNLNDNQKWALILTVAARIDAITGQWFNADYGVWRVDGKGSPLVQHPSMIPILGVEEVEVDSAATNNRNAPPPKFLVDVLYAGEGRYGNWGVPALGILTAASYTRHTRAIEKVHGYFPGGALNVKVTGALGWADDYARVEADITNEIDSASLFIAVADVAGFEARDVVDIIGVSQSARVIITSVDTGNNRLNFDPVGTRALPEAIPALTATVRRLAKTPRPIEAVANYLFGVVLLEFAANAAGVPAVDPARIKKESTDGYSYELFPPGGGAGAAMTGSAAHDQTLRAFSAPGRAVVI